MFGEKEFLVQENEKYYFEDSKGCTKQKKEIEMKV